MGPDFSHMFANADAFGAFWSDFLRRAASQGVAPTQPPTPDTFAQLRRAFFDALAEHADKFMRSEAFLVAMKQSLEQSLAFQQTLNDMMKKGLTANQVPTRDDADHITMLVRGVEDRVLDRLERLSRRLDQLEGVKRGANERVAPAARSQKSSKNGAPKRPRKARSAK